MDINHGGHGGRVPQNLEWGTLIQIVSQILSCFKISSTRLLALQCSQKLTNPMTMTEYSLFPKSTSSVSTKSPLQVENLTFFLARTRTKHTAQNAPKHAVSSEKFNFHLPDPSVVGNGIPPTLTP